MSTLIRWDIVLVIYITVLLVPRPDGIALKSWQLLAIFIATIIGLIVQPIAGGAMVLIGVLAIALGGVMPIRDALAGYADPVVWMVLAAFFMSRRDDQDRPGQTHRVFVHTLDRPPLARAGLRAGFYRRAACDLHPLKQRAFGRHHLSDSQEPGRSLRLEARRDSRAARLFLDDIHLPVRSHNLRDVSDGPGVEPADR